MLYDHNRVKPSNPLSLESFILWLEQQPPEDTYDFQDYRGACLICQYLTATGVDFADHYLTFTARYGDAIARTKPWTFGAALGRARKVADRK